MAYSEEQFRKDVEENPNLELEEDQYDVGYISARKSTGGRKYLAFLNTSEDEIRACGLVELAEGVGASAVDMEKYFENPMKPSPEECILYELEFGIPYLILGVL